MIFWYKETKLVPSKASTYQLPLDTVDEVEGSKPFNFLRQFGLFFLILVCLPCLFQENDGVALPLLTFLIRDLLADSHTSDVRISKSLSATCCLLLDSLTISINYNLS